MDLNKQVDIDILSITMLGTKKKGIKGPGFDFFKP